MKLQVIEFFTGGHHTNYVTALINQAAQALAAGRLSEMVVTITERHGKALRAEAGLPLDVTGIYLDTSLPDVSADPSFTDRELIFKATRDSIAAHKADLVVAASADYDVLNNAIHAVLSRRKANMKTASAGVFHYGYPDQIETSPRDRLKQKLYEFGWKHSDWQHLLFVNPLMLERARQTPGIASRSVLLPDPVPVPVVYDQAQARAALGLPKDGYCLAHVGGMDGRKAIAELLAAFRNYPRQDSEFVLLAGELSPRYRDLIEHSYHDLVTSGQLRLVDKRLSVEELALAYSACDALALLYYPRPNLSANLLKTISYGKPALVDRYGYTGMMVERFRAGITCDVTNTAAVQDGLLRLRRLAEDYQPMEASARLLEFHSEANYFATIMSCVADSGWKSAQSPLTWEWVCGQT